jgi:hypothetical protein
MRRLQRLAGARPTERRKPLVPAGHASAAAAVTKAANRLDGVKMVLPAAMAVSGTLMARRTRLLPRWLQTTGVALAIAITASGIGYALLNNTCLYFSVIVSNISNICSQNWIFVLASVAYALAHRRIA